MRLIDADALIAEAKEMMDENELMDGVPTIIEDYCDAQPTVDDVPVRHGKWIRLGQKHDGGYLWIRCSVCGYEDIDSPVCMTKYCPDCGARMDADDKDHSNGADCAGL